MAGNFVLLRDLLERDSAAATADVVVTPECFLDGYVVTEPHVTAADMLGYAQPPEASPALQWAREWAASTGTWMIVGCTTPAAVDSTEAGPCTYNSAVVIDRGGLIVGMYHKTHCQTHDQKFVPGPALPVFEGDFGPFGVMICADRRWPETVRTLSAGGARIIFAPTYGMHDAKNLMMMQTRSYESEIFIAFTHPEQALLTNAWGSILVNSEGEEPAVIVTEVALDEVDVVRQGPSAHLRDRRLDLYGGAAESQAPADATAEGMTPTVGAPAGAGASPADRAANQHVRIASTRATELPWELLLRADPSPGRVEAYLGQSDGFAAVAAGGAIVGALVLTPRGRAVSEITNVAVAAAFEGRGIATALIETAITDCRRRGLERVIIKTGTIGVVQLLLYQKLGFRPVSVEYDHFTREYAEPIIENGARCFDQITLEYRIRSNEVVQALAETFAAQWMSSREVRPPVRVARLAGSEKRANALLNRALETNEFAGLEVADLVPLCGPEPAAADVVVLVYGDGSPAAMVEIADDGGLAKLL